MEIWVEEIEGWDQRPFAGGYAALHDLAEQSFSGAVSSGAVWLLFVNGRVVSVGQYRQGPGGASFDDAEITAFEAGEGTVYDAPHPSVPLLVAMQLADGETRGRYYTEQTPIAEVDETLTAGSFTGYLELSENVLSGDYYTVYQAGRSMDLGFVGNARRLETDEPARETARDEVGIYEVVAVDLEVTAIPEGDDASAAAASTPTTGDDANDDPTADNDASATADREPPTEPETERSTPEWASGDLTARPGHEAEEGDGVGNPPADGPTTDGSEPRAASVDDETEPGAEATSDHPPDADAAAESATTRVDGTGSTTEAGHEEPTGAVTSATVEDDRPADEGVAGQDAVDDRAETTISNTPAPPSDQSAVEGSAGATGSPTEQLASRSVPSLDPARSSDRSGMAPDRRRRDRPGEGETAASEAAETPTTVSGAADETTAGKMPDGHAEPAATETARKTAETAREEAEARVAELESTLKRVKRERDDLRTERDDLQAEVDRLRERVAELEARTGETSDGPSLSTAEALAGTNLFVRYGSKGKTTVKDVHDGAGTLEELDANLKITSHTQFETAGATVDSEPFDEWLAARQEYRFAEWLIARFVFEVQDTGSADRLPDIYDALPAIDRIEFDGSVTGHDGEGEREVGFDVVCRDRMGDPLVVADLDASRDPVGEAAMATLVQDALGVCRNNKSLAAAFSVTAAFFESTALETAADATGSSLLSRDSRLSYVKESRKRGFHLALVESRDGDFHLTVPDL